MENEELAAALAKAETAQAVKTALRLTEALEYVKKFSCVEEMEVDVYRHVVIADIQLTNGHHIRIPFSTLANTHHSVNTLSYMVRTIGSL